MLYDDAQYLRAVRTLTQEEVDERARVRDKFTPTPAERLQAADHGSEVSEIARH